VADYFDLIKGKKMKKAEIFTRPHEKRVQSEQKCEQNRSLSGFFLAQREKKDYNCIWIDMRLHRLPNACPSWFVKR